MVRKYLSDDCSHYKCLERHLMQGGFGKLPDANLHRAQHSKDNTVIVFEEMKRQNSDLMRLDRDNVADKVIQATLDIELPTRLDSPWAYHQISLLIDQVKETANRLGLETGEFPLHATVPTGQVNAMAVKLECSSKTFLLFDSQLLTFCNLVAKLYAQCLAPNENFGSGNPKIMRAVIEGTPEIVIRLKRVLEAFFRTGRPGTSPPFPVDTTSASLSHIFRTGMELFVVGHEFGHFYAGHLGKVAQQLNVVAPDLSFPESHIEEFEADYLALVLTIHALKKEGYEVRMIVGAIKLFFSTLDLAKRYADFLSYGPNRKFVSEENDSHPSNESRKRAIDQAVEKMFVEEEDVQSAQQFYMLIEQTTDFLWESMVSIEAKVKIKNFCSCGSGRKKKKCCGR